MKAVPLGLAYQPRYVKRARGKCYICNFKFLVGDEVMVGQYFSKTVRYQVKLCKRCFTSGIVLSVERYFRKHSFVRARRRQESMYNKEELTLLHRLRTKVCSLKKKGELEHAQEIMKTRFELGAIQLNAKLRKEEKKNNATTISTTTTTNVSANVPSTSIP